MFQKIRVDEGSRFPTMKKTACWRFDMLHRLFLILELFEFRDGLKTAYHAFIAHRILVDRARGLILHSSNDGRIGSEAISR